MANLTLTVKKKWFDMYVSGEKREDYREEKEYWLKRLFTIVKKGNWSGLQPKKFDKVIIKNGYGKNAQTLIFKHVRTYIGCGDQKLGAPANYDDVIIIKMK